MADGQPFISDVKKLFTAFLLEAAKCVSAIPNGWEFLRYVFNHTSEHVKNMSSESRYQTKQVLGHALSEGWMFWFESVRVSIKVLVVCSMEGHVKVFRSFRIRVFSPC